MAFRNRADAGRRLAAALSELAGPDVVVTGLPRGGVPVAAEVARVLHAPLDVLVVRKLGVPWQSELAMGAIGEDGVRVLNREVLEHARLDAAQIEGVERRERAELERRAAAYRGDHGRVDLDGKVVVIVDDGIATGSTARAAVEVAREHGARRVVVAVPVAPPESVAMLREVADEVVCLETPAGFGAVGAWYEDFRQTGDEEVVATLRELAARREDAG